ncbi:nuclear receptor subfamily 6 group A member 1-like [Lampetra fluviatilis]
MEVVEKLIFLFRRMQLLRVTREEFAFLKVISYLNQDTVGISDPATLERLSRCYWFACQEFVQGSHSPDTSSPTSTTTTSTTSSTTSSTTTSTTSSSAAYGGNSGSGCPILGSVGPGGQFVSSGTTAATTGTTGTTGTTTTAASSAAAVARFPELLVCLPQLRYVAGKLMAMPSEYLPLLLKAVLHSCRVKPE